MENDFGWGMVKPDFLTNGIFPATTGTTYIRARSQREADRQQFEWVNVTWIQTDGSAGFGGPPGTSLFEWHLDASGTARRMRSARPMSLASRSVCACPPPPHRASHRTFAPCALAVPSSLSADLMVDLVGFQKKVDSGDFQLPHACRNASVWTLGPVTPLASRFARLVGAASAK